MVYRASDISLFVKNAAFCEGLCLIRSSHQQRWWSFSEQFGSRTCKMSIVHARSHEITNKPLRVRTTKTLRLPTWKTNYNAEKCASDVKKMKNFEGEANNMQLDKEDTPRSN